MAHKRQLIREAAAAAVTGLTTTGTNVFESLDYALEKSKLPALAVYTPSEQSEPLTIGTNRSYLRELNLQIEATAQAKLNAVDTIDTICSEVEAAIELDPTLGGLAKDSFLNSTDVTKDNEGAKPTYTAVLIFKIIYQT